MKRFVSIGLVWASVLLLASCDAAIALHPLPSTAVASGSAFELTMPVDGSVVIALADRPDRLDVATAKLIDRLEFPAKAGERVTVFIDAIDFNGDDVVRNFVQPLGGDAAVDAFRAAAPNASSHKVVELRTLVSAGARAQHSVITFASQHTVMTALSQDRMMPNDSLHLRDWVTPTDRGATATVVQDGRLLVGDGRAASTYPAPLMALWLQILPTTASR